MLTISLRLGERLSVFNLALLGRSSCENHGETSRPDVFPGNTCSDSRLPVEASSRQTEESSIVGQAGQGRLRVVPSSDPGDWSLVSLDQILRQPWGRCQASQALAGCSEAGVSWAARRGEIADTTCRAQPL